MAKYCIHCGKKLKEGEVCDCQANVQVQTNDLGTNFVEVLKGMFVKPIDTIKGYTDEKHFNLALILVGVFSLSAALFMLSLVKNMTEMATSSMGGLTLYAITTTSVQIPYLQIFFVGLIAVIAFTFITSLIFTEQEIVNAARHFRIIFLLAAAFYGLYGIVLAFLYFLSHVTELKTMGKPYFYPIAPFDKIYLLKGLLKTNIVKDTKRSSLLTHKNKTKQRRNEG